MPDLQTILVQAFIVIAALVLPVWVMWSEFHAPTGGQPQWGDEE